MTLNDYLSTHETASDLARRMDITPVLLSQWRHKKRPVPFDKALQIEKLSDGKVSRIELCESDWHTVWPDLKIEAVSQ